MILNIRLLLLLLLIIILHIVIQWPARVTLAGGALKEGTFGGPLGDTDYWLPTSMKQWHMQCADSAGGGLCTNMKLSSLSTMFPCYRMTMYFNICWLFWRFWWFWRSPREADTVRNHGPPVYHLSGTTLYHKFMFDGCFCNFPHKNNIEFDGFDGFDGFGVRDDGTWFGQGSQPCCLWRCWQLLFVSLPNTMLLFCKWLCYRCHPSPWSPHSCCWKPATT